jgi:curved DNA-binding protein CbpA
VATDSILSQLKKACARHGIYPDGSPDELYQGLVDKLVAAAPSDTAAAPGSKDDAAADDAPTKVDPVKVAKEVLRLSEMGEPESILNIAASKGETLTAKSPLTALRKAYLKLSMIIHPDKLRGFEDATKAFQGLCAAFEQLTRPDIPMEGGKDNKAKKLARSNEGCVVTCIKCPRCRVQWGQKVDGTPEYFYNFIMTGLKSYTCSTCLFEFGCMAAIHCCTYCKHEFEYSPGDFHRKIECGNKKCHKTFGFYEHHIPDRTMKDCIKEAKADFERLARQREAKQRRAASMAKRGGPINSEQASH